MKTSNFNHFVKFDSAIFNFPHLELPCDNEQFILFAFLSSFEPPYAVGEMIENYFYSYGMDRCVFLTPSGITEGKLNLMSNIFTYQFFTTQNDLIKKYHNSTAFHTQKFVFTVQGKHRKLNYNIPVINVLLDDWKIQVKNYGKHKN